MSRQNHDKLWLEFVDWCHQRHLKSMPAHAWTVAAYLRWKDRQGTGRKIGKTKSVGADRLIRVISRAHLLCGHRSPHAHPVITKTLASIERRKATAPDRTDLFGLGPFQATGPAQQGPDDVDGVKDMGKGIEKPDIVSGIRTGFSLRTRPRLVSRRVPEV